MNKTILRKQINKLSYSKLCHVYKYLWDICSMLQYHTLCLMWAVSGHHRPVREKTKKVVANVTFIYKSFERKEMAKRLFYCIQKYYPGVKAIIADDSRDPLQIDSPYVEIIHLPFNSGLSKGINAALLKVKTPYVVRMDDDELFTPFTHWEQQLEFLESHSDVDIVAVQAKNPIQVISTKTIKITESPYYKFNMNNAPRQLIVPHMTQIDDTHYISGKVPNVFMARTEKYRSLGYDDNIRMIDHHEFFYRAAGILVSAMDMSAFVYHYHNPFDNNYNKYRNDYKGDQAYIYKKHYKKS